LVAYLAALVALGFSFWLIEKAQVKISISHKKDLTIKRVIAKIQKVFP
jgi:Holliday junction resolvasome RuvABC DNA-binding subunit